MQLHWHLNKFYESKPLDTEQLPHSVGHFFEEQIEAFLDREKDEDKLKLKRGFCDWFLKWELVDTGVSNLKNQVQTVICYTSKSKIRKLFIFSVCKVLDRVH